MGSQSRAELRQRKEKGLLSLELLGGMSEGIIQPVENVLSRGLDRTHLIVFFRPVLWGEEWTQELPKLAERIKAADRERREKQ
ncbi:hypothetical protein G3480_18465 [Thiorhodococcus mannitoliphagus]|uniref:Uncharacterized protein n=1 Tax=Thiorhodococcus mannitoliphagus TaxID=329406 RepID=A0A6P1E2L9_9GAMM|nr:hypothetical protein [Thiorhodococcus mannitoliphagus]NEX22264.1 hypothetical protein [Thiorhodococcus mannitoliphagus]